MSSKTDEEIETDPKILSSMPVIPNSEVYRSQKFISYLGKFFDSPFKEDRKFVVQYLA